MTANLQPKPVLPPSVWESDSSVLEPLRKNAALDRFGYFPRAWALARLIANTETPFTIGVYAEWGRGKSTLLNTLEFILTDMVEFIAENSYVFSFTKPEDNPVCWPRVHVLKYSPWRFRLESFEDVWLSMIEDIRAQVDEQMDGRWDEESRVKFLNISKKARLRRALEHLVTSIGAVPFFGITAKLLWGLSKARRELLEDGLPRSIHAFFAENQEALSSLFGNIPDKGRVLLIMDDMDRCDPRIAVELLRAVEVFARTKGLICLVAMDQDVVVESLQGKYGSEEHANEYLHKIIQLAVTPVRVSTNHARQIITTVLPDQKKEPGNGSAANNEPLPMGELQMSPDYDRLRSEPWNGFIHKHLCYNPRSFEKFTLIYDFRWSVIGEELRDKDEELRDKDPDPIMTAAQAVIELRWPKWNRIAYRFPGGEKAFKDLMRNHTRNSTEWETEARLLRAKFPFLKRFLEDESLCDFYEEYYRLRLEEQFTWVSSRPGEIFIRNLSIQHLAQEHSFLEIAGFLTLGQESCLDGNDKFESYLADSFERLRSENWILDDRHYAMNDPLWSISNTLDRLAEPSKSRRPLDVEITPIAETAFAWAAMVLTIAQCYQQNWWPADTTRLIHDFAKSLSERELTCEETRLLEIHMSLQIVSPRSPSSTIVRKRLSKGASLAEALHAGVNRFWTKDHGLASRDLAELLQNAAKSGGCIEDEVKARLDEGKKIPGFGSHEHKGGIKDPRIALYKNITYEKLWINSANEWYWKSGEELRKVVREVLPRAGLSVNPDYYMTLLHFALGIPAERMPLSFLIGRTIGWCAASLEHVAGHKRRHD